MKRDVGNFDVPCTYVAVCCSVLQCVAVCCSVLQFEMSVMSRISE